MNTDHLCKHGASFVKVQALINEQENVYERKNDRIECSEQGAIVYREKR